MSKSKVLKNCIFSIVFLCSLLNFAQDNYHFSFTVPEQLRKEANAVVRYGETSVEIEAIDKMIVSEKRIVTVYNSHGKRAVGARVYYNNDIKVKQIQVLVFDSYGKQINKFKKSDFKDVSAVAGGTLYSDSRILYLDYTPISYPYTVEFTSQISTSNTAFIPSFTPVSSYEIGVENFKFKINYPDHMTLRKKEKNLDGVDMELISNENYKLIYSVKNIEPYEQEAYSPPFRDLVPKVLFAANEFNYEGVEGKAQNWEDFGKWVYDNMIQGANDLPEATKLQIQELVKNEISDVEKAKKIYQYVQDKVRYISVQVGIGGWRPYSSKYVDDLSYGDCKALTNYTMSLLHSVGVKSYFTLLFAGKYQRDIEKDFAIMQANHAILTIPESEGENIWLECTSQDLPFGFIGDFTDDRDVLVITPEGGKIKHTKKYTTEENTQILKGTYKLTQEGGIEAEVDITSNGIQYDDKYSIDLYDDRDKDMTYKKRWRYINSISFDDIQIKNNKQTVEFNEHLKFSAKSYSKKAGDRLLFAINALNRNRYIPDRYRNRKFPVIVKRGFIDVDEVRVVLPKGYKVESLPKGTEVKNKFGSYHTEISEIENNVIVYKRKFKINDGEYPKEDYAAFREFYKTVSKLDNAKAALIKIN
ncbi:hypothetical protein MHTCC0001_25210 [Flavobacteriaceae bacterium MHTCC 0001]